MRLRDLLDDHIRASRGVWRCVGWGFVILGAAFVLGAIVVAGLEVRAWSQTTTMWHTHSHSILFSPMGVVIASGLVGVALVRIGRGEFEGLDEYEPAAKKDTN